MTKADLIKAVSARSCIHPTTVEEVLDGLAGAATAALDEGGDVTIPGLIKLGTKLRAERQGRNPGTGEAITIPAKTVITAKPVKALADLVA